jgi:hypothetical protein
MKYIVLIALAILLGVNNSSSYAQVVREGNTFSSVQQSNRRSSNPPVKTKYTYKENDEIYPIYISMNTGSCFIIKKSRRTGKEYRKYLGEEISRQICKEMGIEYKPKNK